MLKKVLSYYVSLNMKNNKCFFAYPSKTLSHVEIIEEAIKELNNSQVVEVIGWKKNSYNRKVYNN